MGSKRGPPFPHIYSENRGYFPHQSRFDISFRSRLAFVVHLTTFDWFTGKLTTENLPVFKMALMTTCSDSLFCKKSQQAFGQLLIGISNN